ncbi:winged helix-turn-helix domain-containing protein [Kangiella sediminilitoris]|uniref:OmpR/PhoB-type domain-containing protein n=1 Tax=Kangiella sediminilitoris TaxID=1144748 RepID=A0A1B3BAG7_9GAMM|nr:winged helix-turn-helix domain-containing protein [Kangiella sediminilitoris]AOE49764.1 hypothetical protein KS2013_1044 [Kangiella sediminilitoris]
MVIISKLLDKELGLQMDRNREHKTEPIGEDYIALDDSTYTLKYDGQSIALRPKTFKVLKVFLSNPNKVLTKDSIIQDVWPSTVISDDCLTQCIVEIRKVLKDDGHSIIKTFPKRGYSFNPGQLKYPATDQNKRFRLAVLSVSLVVSIVFAIMVWLYGPERKTKPVPPLVQNSIAVLPFKSQADSEVDYSNFEFISDGIVSLVSEHTQLQVISSNAASEYYEKLDGDQLILADELKASHIVTGVFNKGSGGDIRLTVQLIETDGFQVVLTKSFHDALETADLLPFYIAHLLVEHFKTEHFVTKEVAINQTAIELYKVGEYYLDKRGDDNILTAEQKYSEALKIEPNYADALAGLSSVYFLRGLSGEDVDDELLTKSKDFAEQALDIDPYHPVANIRFADSLYHLNDIGLEFQRNSFEKVMVYAPDHPLILGRLAGSYLIQGETVKALSIMKKLVELRPESLVFRNNLAHTYYYSGKYEEAIEEFYKIADESDIFRQEVMIEIAKILLIQGKEEEVKEMLVSMEPSVFKSFLEKFFSEDKVASIDLDDCQVRLAMAICLALAEIYVAYDQQHEFNKVLAILKQKVNLGRSYSGYIYLLVSLKNSPVLRQNPAVKGILSELQA